MAKWSAMRGMTGSTARTNSVVANTASIDRPSTRPTGGGRLAATDLTSLGGPACIAGRFYRSATAEPSRLLKFVFEGGGCATLIQDRALRRMKDSARPGPGFE